MHSHLLDQQSPKRLGCADGATTPPHEALHSDSRLRRSGGQRQSHHLRHTWEDHETPQPKILTRSAAPFGGQHRCVQHFEMILQHMWVLQFDPRRFFYGDPGLLPFMFFADLQTKLIHLEKGYRTGSMALGSSASPRHVLRGRGRGRAPFLNRQLRRRGRVRGRVRGRGTVHARYVGGASRRGRVNHNRRVSLISPLLYSTAAGLLHVNRGVLMKFYDA